MELLVLSSKTNVLATKNINSNIELIIYIIKNSKFWN